MGESEWEEKPGGEELHPDSGHAHTKATHPGSSHAALDRPPTRANAARNSAPREQSSSPGPRREWGFKRGRVS
ncbi:Teneurin-4 [Manis pentadactyla]|nr:Teneurin-4 [Manis pentadactyla]